MVWYAHLLQNFPQFIVIYTVKGFGIVNKAELDVFLELSFLIIQWMLAIWTLVPLPFLKPALVIRETQIKATIKYHSTPIRVAKIKKPVIPSVGEYVEKQNLSYTAA